MTIREDDKAGVSFLAKVDWEDEPENEPTPPPCILIRFAQECPDSVVKATIDRLNDPVAGMGLVATDLTLDDGSVHQLNRIGLSATGTALRREAEHLKLQKEMRDPMKVVNDVSDDSPSMKVMEEFSIDNERDFINIDEGPMVFFTTAEIQLLVLSIFDAVRLFDDRNQHDDVQTPRSVDPEIKSRDFFLSSMTKSSSPLSQAVDAYLETRLKSQYTIDGQDYVDNPYMKEHLVRHNIIDIVTPLHIPTERNSTCRTQFQLNCRRTDNGFDRSIHPVCDYYGPRCAYYFAWMDCYTRNLMFPGVAGLLLYLYRTLILQVSVDDCPYTPFFGVLVSLWGVLFMKFWKRYEISCAWLWGTYGEEDTTNTRPNFRGTPRVSPVTGTVKLYSPLWIRKMKQLGSTIVTLCLVAVAFFWIICSLNMQGYVDPAHDRGRWPEDSDHIFHIPFLAQLAQPGAIFDPNSTFKSLVPVLLHVAFVMGFNSFYRSVATALTEWENHENEVTFEDSVIMKRFFFEACDAFLPLFYLGFYEFDIVKLRSELISLFHVDCLRRLALECLVPMALHFMKGKDEKSKKELAGISKKFDDEKDRKNYNRFIAAYESSITDEAELDEYEQFDDVSTLPSFSQSDHQC